MKKNNKKGMWINQEIIDDKNLDCADRFILSEIYSLCKLPNGCIAADEHFAKIIRKSISNTNKRVNRLKELGYINTFIHTINKKILGRTITINKKEKNDLAFQNVEVSISKKEDLVFQNVEVSISKKEDLVFQNVEVSISPVNINNTITNSYIINQETNQYTGEEIFSKKVNLGNSAFQVLSNTYQELSFKLMNISSIGDKVFNYASHEGIKNLKLDIDRKESDELVPLLLQFIEVDRQLYGNK
jgi:DNA-binding Lrp family transcriptional regulator